MKLEQLKTINKGTPLLCGTQTVFFHSIGLNETTRKREVKTSNKPNGRVYKNINPLALRPVAA